MAGRAAITLATRNDRSNRRNYRVGQTVASLETRNQDMLDSIPFNPLASLALSGDTLAYADNQTETDAVDAVFARYDQDKNGNLDVDEFGNALHDMGIALPTPLIRKVFRLIDYGGVSSNGQISSNDQITSEEFLKFINEEGEVFQFPEVYTLEFHTRPIGIELEMDPNLRTVYVSKMEEKLKKEILPKSEVIEIGDEEITAFTKSLDGLTKIPKFLETLDFPIRITFKQEVDKAKLGILSEDEEWNLLNRHVSARQFENRRNNIDFVERGHCKHCPEEGSYSEMVHKTFEDEMYTTLSVIVITTVMLLIFLSTAVYLLTSIRTLRDKKEFVIIEYIVSISFTVEYAMRIASCRNMFVYFWDPMNMVDFLAVIPFWAERTDFGNDTSNGGKFLLVLRVLRLSRVFRLLKSPHFREILDVISTTLIKSSHAFGLIISIILLFVIVCASLAYVFEAGTLQPDGLYSRPGEEGTESRFNSIPSAMYWCVVTMTTVGYGDIYPLTAPGQIVGIITMFSGLIVIALPVIIIDGAFVEVYDRYKKMIERRARNRELEVDAKLNSVPFRKVEEYFDKLNHHIDKACGTEDLDIFFFGKDDVSAFVEEGFDTEEKVISLLKTGEVGLHFFPKGIRQWKLLMWYELFGKKYRGTLPSDPFIRIRNRLMKRLNLEE